ncbi:MAG: ABC transporter substrate-binding protein [Actinomycetota bacterium]|nr:ABC transporter substrate-binding protein [Actinomycetota bacterium]
MTIDAAPLGAAPRSRSRRTRLAAVATLTALVITAAACGGDDDDEAVSADDDTSSETTTADDTATDDAAGEDTEADAGEVTEIDLQLSWLPDTEFAPLFLADANGYLDEAGVDVEFISGGPDIGAVEAIVGSGAADVGIATDIFSVISAAAEGSPFVVLGTLYQSNLHGFISPQDAPIETAADLAGARLGGSQGVQPKFEAILELNGEDPSDYTFVPAGFGPDLLINGDVDAQSVFITDEVLAYRDATGEDPVIVQWDELGLPSYTLVLFTTQDYLDENRDALMGMLEAIQRGQADNAADPEAGPTVVAEVYGADAGMELEAEIAKNAEYLQYAESDFTDEHGYLWVDPEFLETEIYAGMEASGQAVAPVEDVLDMSLLEEIGG